MHVNRDNKGINFAFSFMLFNDYKCLRLASPENTSHVIAPANDELSILVAFPPPQPQIVAHNHNTLLGLEMIGILG